MPTVEQLFEEASKLTKDERRRLRDALVDSSSNGEPEPHYKTHYDERAWINTHRDEYLWQWVALDGDHLVAHSTDARTVYDEARARGVSAPYLAHITPKVEAYVGGWCPDCRQAGRV